MGTILDYVKEYGDYTFAQKPINEVDSLVLSQFSYLKFDGIVPELGEEKEAVTIGYLNEHQDKDKLFADERYLVPNTELFEAMVQSVRFGSMRMNHYANIIETHNETQFSAITFILDDGTVYIAYRGTDETIIGWKEDFNLAFSEPVPGQLRSVKYLNWVAEKITSDFYVGGHSKGGNFAVYASMNCRREYQDRILKIYNHDGPGFRPEVRESGHYEQIADRVVKIIPHSSVVGMILESHADGYLVVESKTFGLLQHNPYTWLVSEDKFVEANDIYKGTRIQDDTLNEWILSMDQEHIHSFVDTLYEVVAASKAETLLDFSADWKKSMTAMIAAYKELDDETATMLKRIVASLFEKIRERTRDEIHERTAEGWTILEEKATEGWTKLEEMTAEGRSRLEEKTAEGKMKLEKITEAKHRRKRH